MDECLKVDLDRLRDTARGLGALEHELSCAGKIVEDAVDDVGSHHVEAALHDFVSDWRIRRGRLVAQVEAVKDMAQTSADTFAQVDAELAAALPGGRR